MLVLEKIRSHKFENTTDHSTMFLLSLAETYKTLDIKRQLTVQRKFIHILEVEFNEQEEERRRATIT